jgi:ADP-ribosylglycohydrolase
MPRAGVQETAAALLKHVIAACSTAGLDKDTGVRQVLEAMLEEHISASAAASKASDSTNAHGEGAQAAPDAAATRVQHPPQTQSTAERDARFRGFRARGCLLGLAVGDAVAVARGSSRPATLAELNAHLGGEHGPLDAQVKHGKGVQLAELCGLYDIAIGGWSHATASCLATAQSVEHCKALDTCDLMMRLLKMFRTGRGTCLPGFSGGVDKASVEAFEIFERTSNHQSGAVYGCSSLHGVSSGALARVPPVVLFKCTDPTEAIQAVAQNTRATHDVVATIDASRYMAAILCAILTSTSSALTTKTQVDALGPHAHRQRNAAVPA